MKYRRRTCYTDAQKAVKWERWKQGWMLHQIAQLFNRPQPLIVDNKPGAAVPSRPMRWQSRSRTATAAVRRRRHVDRQAADPRQAPLRSREGFQGSVAARRKPSSTCGKCCANCFANHVIASIHNVEEARCAARHRNGAEALAGLGMVWLGDLVVGFAVSTAEDDARPVAQRCRQ